MTFRVIMMPLASNTESSRFFDTIQKALMQQIHARMVNLIRSTNYTQWTPSASIMQIAMENIDGSSVSSQPSWHIVHPDNRTDAIYVTQSPAPPMYHIADTDPETSGSTLPTYSISHSQFRELQNVPRVHFSQPFQVGQQDLYQSAHSSYERISPVEEFGREVVPDSDALQSYATMQNVEASGILTSSTTTTVDAATLQNLYPIQQMILDQHNRLVPLQRVISPDDRTMVQPGTLSLRRDSNDPNQPPSFIVLPTNQGFASLAMPTSLSAMSKPVTSLNMLVGPSPVFQTKISTSAIGLDHTTLGIRDGRHLAVLSKCLHPDNMADATQSESDEMDMQTQDGNNSAHLLHSVMVNTATGPIMSQGIIDASMEGLADESLTSTLQTTVDGNAPDHVSMAALMSSHIGVSPGSTGTVLHTDRDNKENILPERRDQRVRKSNRIAIMEADMFSAQPRPRYRSKLYNVTELWCEECQSSYSSPCPDHWLIQQHDKVVLSLAWASLPATLQIFRFPPEQDVMQGCLRMGVFAKKVIHKYTQFGPFIGDLVNNREEIRDTNVLLQLDNDKDVKYFSTSDENKCNWMMFVRAAENYSEQNLVAYQYGYDVFFTVIKPISVHEELKVWYAGHYAERLGIPVHPLTDRDMEELAEKEFTWPCFECSKKFRSHALLQKHLIVHEGNDASSKQQWGDDERWHNSKAISGKADQATKKPRRGRPPKKIRDLTEPGKFQSWKKRTTNMYLNKTLKKYKKRHDTDAIKRTIKSLYKKTGKVSGGVNEWICTHCELTFDNPSLLNLHTLTHAAEDVGFTDVPLPLSADINGITDSGHMPGGWIGGSIMPGLADGMTSSIIATSTSCPVCFCEFANRRDLIEHAAAHGRPKRSQEKADESETELDDDRDDELMANQCQHCLKVFTTFERLQKHKLVHGDESSKPYQCTICFKRFVNNSALACHKKTHVDRKYYECIICKSDFDQGALLKEHVKIHIEHGIYYCLQRAECRKYFKDYNSLKKHVKSAHCERKFSCAECQMAFSRADKLRLHMLKHSSLREFMCDTCGKQFKRKDKLKEHIKRLHSIDHDIRMKEKLARQENNPKRFIPKVSPTDYHRFIYKCHTCLLGFKRRGMLVNHLAKRHPDMKPEAVPELNLPILRTQRDYFCQYCEKVYKSSSKRKAHIVKQHPGAELPISGRKKGTFPEYVPLWPNPSYSQQVGSVTTMPQQCAFCHKQYASKAKLLQHQRNKHPDFIPPVGTHDRRLKPNRLVYVNDIVSDVDVDNPEIVPSQQQTQDLTNALPITTVVVTGGQMSEMPATDLLSQAMSELTQSLREFQTHSTGVNIVGTNGLQTSEYQIQTPPRIQLPTSTIELSHLGQTLAHLQAQTTQQQQQQLSSVLNTTHITIQAPPPLQQQNNPINISPSTTPTPVEITSVVQPSVSSPQQDATQQQQVLAQMPISLTYLPRSWSRNGTNFTSYQ